ncbi:hypothetical protein V8B55DRAFT_1410655 [Mucor lusitanicus]
MFLSFSFLSLSFARSFAAISISSQMIQHQMTHPRKFGSWIQNHGSIGRTPSSNCSEQHIVNFSRRVPWSLLNGAMIAVLSRIIYTTYQASRQTESKSKNSPSKRPGLDDESTDEIMRLIEGLKDDDSNENVRQDGKSTADEAVVKDVAVSLNDAQTKQADKKPVHSKKSSDLARWKAEQISDILESYISFREAQDWS